MPRDADDNERTIMAVTVNGKRISVPTLRKWQRQIAEGKRSAFEVERTELGTNGRGKTVTRLFERELSNS